MRDALPPEQTGPQAWYGPDLARRADWIEVLSPEDQDEIRAAVATLAASGGPPSPATFPLPRLGPRLGAIRDELLHGRGFAVLRGLPIDGDAELAFAGLGSHLGSARSQNRHGHLVGHVRDLGLSSADPNVRVYQTNERQTFHTDSCDVVGLLCLRTARVGGESLLVSSSTIWNEMRRRRPDLAALLLEPIATDRRGEVPPGRQPFYAIPVFHWYEGHLSALYQRQYVDSAQRFPDAPRLTSAHLEALDLFDALANDPALHLSMTLAPGHASHRRSRWRRRSGSGQSTNAVRSWSRVWLWLSLIHI